MLETVCACAGRVAAASADWRADVVLDWNRIMLTTVGGQNSFAQARFAATTQLAVLRGPEDD
jgi:hypothetical protein